MNKIKTLIMAVAAAFFVFGTTSCDKENDQYNYNVYQRAVNETVKAQKKNNKVILLVAFGSTWQQAFDSFDSTLEAYKTAFPQYDVFESSFNIRFSQVFWLVPFRRLPTRTTGSG